MANNLISGGPALALVAGSGLVLFATTAGLWLHRFSLRRQARVERATLRLDAFSLRPGRVALSGTVEALDGDAGQTAVEVTLDAQQRRVQARPFLLRLASGVRVRVEPGARPQLRDAPEPGGATRRLEAGETVFVRGVLRGPILAGPNAPRATLVAPRWGAVVLSTHAFSGELDRQASALGFQLSATLLTLVVSQAMYSALYLDWLRGRSPSLDVGVFFWVALVSASVVVGSTLSAWRERPR